MTSKKTLLIPLLLGFAISGCATSPYKAQEVSKSSFAMLSFAQTDQTATVLTEQTVALDQLMKDIVRNSTIRHAAVGAAVGCGIAVVSAGNASSCLSAAAAGGAVGAVSGHLAGKKEVARRMELVSANALVRTIRKSNDTIGSISTDLPKLLAQQEDEVSSLAALQANGTISTAVYEQRLAAIRATRAELAETLLMSSQQARTASANLRNAAAQGQSGLEWHIGAVEQMERETLSARSTISLL